VAAAAGGEGDIDGGGPSELQIIPPVESLELEKEFTVDKRFLRPQFLAQTKSNNYLLNVMCAMESASKGGAGYGVWVEDDTDYVIEGAVCSAALPAPAPAPQRPPTLANVAAQVCSVVFVNGEGDLITPRTDYERTALEG